MKIKFNAFIFGILFLFISSLNAQTLVSIPRDSIDANRPVPVLISLNEFDRSNFEVIIKNGSREVNRITTNGSINIDKIGSRFLAINNNVSINTTYKNKKTTEEKISIQIEVPAVEPSDVEEEIVQIGDKKYQFKKNNSEVLSKLDGNKFRFFIQSAQSKSAYVKKVVIELANGNDKSTVTINSTNLWWQPYFSIEGNFNSAVIKEILFK